MKHPRLHRWPQQAFVVCYPPTVTIAPDYAALILAIVDHVGCKVLFSVSDLFRHARVVEGPLQEALRGMTPQQVGIALGSIKAPVAGYMVRRHEKKVYGHAMWDVVKVP